MWLINILQSQMIFANYHLNDLLWLAHIWNHNFNRIRQWWICWMGRTSKRCCWSGCLLRRNQYEKWLVGIIGHKQSSLFCCLIHQRAKLRSKYWLSTTDWRVKRDCLGCFVVLGLGFNICLFTFFIFHLLFLFSKSHSAEEWKQIKMVKISLSKCLCSWKVFQAFNLK